MRFKLRTLMLLAGVIALLLGGWRWFVLEPQRQENVRMTQLTRAGVQVKVETRGPRLLISLCGEQYFQRIVRADGKTSDDKRRLLEPIPSCRSLEWLAIYRGELREEDFRGLSRLENLMYLHLFGVPISDAELSYLTAFRNLKVLFLFQSAATDAGLQRLADCPNLEFILLNDNPHVTWKGVKELRLTRPDIIISW